MSLSAIGSTQDRGPLPIVIGAASIGAATFLLGRALDRGPRAAAVIAQRPQATSATPTPAPPPSSWVYPVPSLGARVPEISDGWGSRRYNADGSRRLHLGADIMFPRRGRADLIDVYPPGTPHGTAGYFMPDDVPALSAGAGVVTFARWTPRGGTVSVRHPEGWTTYYTHLSALSVTVGQVVAAGQPLGIIGGDPLDRRRLMHLHVELWRDHARRGATDPAPYLRAMQRRAIDHPVALRNRGPAPLTYRSIGARGERYPAWVQALRGQSGVYVIRERTAEGDPVVVYVGESHTQRLY
jgi:murein DD-endopeptidase MepM/ murein hydrolase activator NlpD